MAQLISHLYVFIVEPLSMLSILYLSMPWLKGGIVVSGIFNTLFYVHVCSWDHTEEILIWDKHSLHAVS